VVELKERGLKREGCSQRKESRKKVEKEKEERRFSVSL
jgi:hypothetical protein